MEEEKRGKKEMGSGRGREGKGRKEVGERKRKRERNQIKREMKGRVNWGGESRDEETGG